MQKKLFASLLVALALICACAVAASAVGTLADDGVYEISTAEEMHELATLIAGKGEGYGDARAAQYRLTRDIDMSAITGMLPIGGNSSNAFTGSFDGQGHTISGIHLEPAADATGDYYGLFGRVANATISNLTIEGTVTSGGMYVGGLVGLVASGATIENCVNRCDVTCTKTNNVYGTGYGVGGIVGHAGGGTGGTLKGTLIITDCVNEGDILSGKSVGGIVGRSDITEGTVTITGCKNTGNVTADLSDGSGYADVGGIIGFDMSVDDATNHVISNCVNTGAVAFARRAGHDFSKFTKGIGFKGVGGIIGRTIKTGITVSACYNAGTVTSDGEASGTEELGAYMQAIAGRGGAVPVTENNYYKPGCGVNFTKFHAAAVDLALVSTSAAIYKDGSATVRYIAKLTTDDSTAVERYGMLLAQTAAQANVKAAAISDAFEGGETTYAVDLTEIPETERATRIYAWAYVNLAGGVQITLPVDAVTVSGIIGG